MSRDLSDIQRAEFQLAKLAKEYDEARYLADSRAQFGPGMAPTNTCRYCGKHWQKMAGTKLDGHAACVITESFSQIIVDIVWNDPKITQTEAAKALGVSGPVLRAWIHRGLKSRGLPGLR